LKSHDTVTKPLTVQITMNKSNKDRSGSKSIENEWELSGIESSKLQDVFQDVFQGLRDTKWRGSLLIGSHDAPHVGSINVIDSRVFRDTSMSLTLNNSSSDVGGCIKPLMHITEFVVRYTVMEARRSKAGKKQARNGDRYDLDTSEPRSENVKLISFAIGDLICANCIFNRSWAGKADSQRRKVEEVESTARKAEILAAHGVETHGVESDHHVEQFHEKKRQLQQAAAKWDSSNASNGTCRFLGHASQGSIFKLNKMEPAMKGSLDDFLQTRLVVGEVMGLSRTMSDTYYDSKLRKTVVANDSSKLRAFAVWFQQFASDALVDRLVNYFYFGKDAYKNTADMIMFDTPISMHEFVDLIDEDFVSYHYGYDKKRLAQLIFKKCNPHQTSVLDKQDPILIENIGQLTRIRENEFLPAYCYRKLHFTKFSNKMVTALADAVASSVNEHIVPKRWRHKRDMAIRNEWAYTRHQHRLHHKEWVRQRDRTQKLRRFAHETKMGLEDE